MWNRVLQDIVIPTIREQIRSVQVDGSGAYNTGSLYQSVSGEVNDDGDGINVLANDYFKFIDQGVKGAQGNRFGVNPSTPYKFGTGTGPRGGLSRGIETWLAQKGLPRELKYPIVKKIYNFGLPTRPLLSPVQSRLENLIGRAVEQGYSEELEEALLYLFEKGIDSDNIQVS
jgi:hypothetical protein